MKMRNTLVTLSIGATLGLVALAAPRDARAGALLIEEQPVVIRSASVIIPQPLQVKGVKLAKGAYVIEFSPEGKAAAHQVMSSETIVVRFFSEEKGALKLKAAFNATLTVVRPPEEARVAKKAHLRDFGFRDGHTVFVSPDGAALRFKAIGEKGASIDFAVPTATT